MGDLRVMVLFTLVLESFASPYDVRYDLNDEIECDWRISGGEDAFFDPAAGFMASIMAYRDNYERVFCSGFILSDDTIGTAGYCVYDVKPSIMDVRVGSTMICFGTRVAIKQKYIHIFYDPNRPEIGRDLAVLKTVKKIPNKDNIHAINYTPYKYKSLKVGTMITVYGYGMTRPGEPESDLNTLMKVEIPIISPDQCTISYFFSVAENEFCAGSILGGRGPCKGDIGGPAVYEGRLVGVVAGGRGSSSCGGPASPSIFADVNERVNSDFFKSKIHIYDGKIM